MLSCFVMLLGYTFMNDKCPGRKLQYYSVLYLYLYICSKIYLIFSTNHYLFFKYIFLEKKLLLHFKLLKIIYKEIFMLR